MTLGILLLVLAAFLFHTKYRNVFGGKSQVAEIHGLRYVTLGSNSWMGVIGLKKLVYVILIDGQERFATDSCLLPMISKRNIGKQIHIRYKEQYPYEFANMNSYRIELYVVALVALAMVAFFMSLKG